MTEPFCMESTTLSGEPLAGTAAEADVFVLLEYRGNWAPKAFEGSELPADVRGHLEGWLADVPRARLQLIRRTNSNRRECPRLFVAQTTGHHPKLVELVLDTYQDVLEIDLPHVLNGSTHARARTYERPMHLVCTHGKRDRCCARWGLPTFRALSAYAEEDVWQTTHLGGHRFAPNVLTLPSGICYGRVAPNEARALVEAHRSGRLFDLDRIRGRSCYGPAAQAAEVFLRQSASKRELDWCLCTAATALDGGRWETVFDTLDCGVQRVRVRATRSSIARPQSCGDEQTPFSAYALESISAG